MTPKDPIVTFFNATGAMLTIVAASSTARAQNRSNERPAVIDGVSTAPSAVQGQTGRPAAVDRTDVSAQGMAPAAEASVDPRVQAMEARLRALETRLTQSPPASTEPARASRSATPTDAPVTEAVQGTSHPSTPANLTLAGYAEAFYQWNFNNPSNGITNYRGFDNRHNTFTLSNVVFDATGTLGPVTARLALQVGTTPETYYLSEPTLPGTNATGQSNFNVWKFIQQANVAWRAPLGRGLLVEAGVFLSPVGPEGMAVHDQWNWSRSNLFFGLPFYHTGARVSYPLSDTLTLTLAGYNGWNSVVDNNTEKSISAALDYVVTDRVTFHVLYFGGVERPTGAPERQNGTVPWRNLFDSYLAVYPRPWLSLLVHGNMGIEPNALGTSWWAAGALYARVQPVRWLYLAARGDFFYEKVPSNALGTASSIFWPSPWVSSQTVTVDVRPKDNVSVRLEYRHDQAEGDTYFRGMVATDPMTQALVPNARSQNTITLGMTAWF
jgi:hypothetical protein